MSKKRENRVDVNPKQFADPELHIDHSEYTRRGRREQAIAVRAAFEWLNATLDRGVRVLGGRLERAITGGAAGDVRTF